MLTALRLMRMFSAAVLILAACFTAFAQTETATLSGVIQDPKGGAVPETEVTVTRIETGTVSTAKTNGAGIYVFTSLMPGHYHMVIRKPGFKEIAIKEFELHVQDKLEQNFSLEIGSVSETVTISGESGMWATTDSPAVGTLVTRDFVENMPLNGRSFQDLLALTPGAVSSANGNGLYSINGQRDNANYFMIDGVSANTYVGGTNQGLNGFAQSLAGTQPAQTALGTTQALMSVDSLQEFRIQTSGYAAEYGRQPGGEVQLTTRSGTNEWHGSAFDYFRNTVFDANNWFANQSGIPREAEHQNDFGGTIGGPVTIPEVYSGKDRTFFFFSYEGLRLLLPNFLRGYVPTTALRQSAATGVQPFINAFPIPNGAPNLADKCTVDGTPNGPPCDALFSAGVSNPSSLDAVSVRVDQNWGEKIRLYGRYSNTPSSSAFRAGDGNFINSITTNGQTYTVGLTTMLNPSLVNDVRFNYSSSETLGPNFRTDGFGGATVFDFSLVAPPQFVQGGAYEAHVLFCLNRHCIGGPGASSQSARQHQYNVVEGLTWTSGRHSVKFGGDFRRLLPASAQTGFYSPSLNLNSAASIQQGVADFDTVSAQKKVYPIINNLSLYAQDHWTMTRGLSVDYGLRWELNPVPTEASGVVPLAVTQITDLANLQLAPYGTPAYRTQYLNFAPRIGFAWDIVTVHHHPVVVRGGFGLYYDTGQSTWALMYFGSSSPPIGSVASYTNVPLPISATTVPPPSLSLPLAPPYFSFGIMDPHLKLPYTEQYNLSADLGLSSRNTLTVSYVGNQGHRLLETQVYPNLNNFPFSGITDNVSLSHYNGLQVSDKGFVAPGLQVLASYTWAHAIDNVSDDFDEFAAPIRGNSDNDVRQVFNLAFNYDIPGGRSNRLVRALTQGWSFSNRFTAQTGFPFNVIQGQYVDAVGRAINIYPDLVGGVPIYLHGVSGVPGGWQLNPAAFNPVALNPDGSPVTQGDLPRNFLKNPGFWNLNTALQRTFPIHEQLNLVFRVEAFNVFNHPNFNGVDNSLGDSTFGQLFGLQTVGVSNQLYATGAPRSWQFMLKLQF